MEIQKQEWQARVDALTAEKEKLNTAIAAALQEAYAKEEAIKQSAEEVGRLKSQCDEATRQMQENRAKEELWKTSQSQLTAAFHNLQGELVKIQNEHNRRDTEWTEKETEWKKAKESWEKTKADLEKSINEVVPVAVSADAQKALSVMRQQMQELRTIFAGLRP